IRRAKDIGMTVVVSDMDPNCPGAEEADLFVKASTFSYEETCSAAEKEKVDAVFTLGTDQPVLPVAKTALKLGLPSGISVETALGVTNKRIMKPIFKKNGIPSCKFRLISTKTKSDDLNDFNYPLVIKPVDSQGQRGVYKVENWGELKEFMPDVLSFSREGNILVEEYYPGDEISVSGWVDNNKLYPLIITDRVTVSNGPHIGVCVSQEYPSKYMEVYKEEIVTISENIVSAFSITNGPVYFQMLIGDEGIKVNEVAVRIGGGYEDESIPALIEVDILNFQFELATMGKIDNSTLQQYQFPSQAFGAVIFMFTKPGVVASNGDIDIVKKIPGVISGKYILKPGRRVGSRENSTARAGYVAIQSKSKNELEELKKKVYSLLEVKDINGDNILCGF
ncbi:MAG: carboxylate--amine ligase, partial [Bacteroidetes bacterium]